MSIGAHGGQHAAPSWIIHAQAMVDLLKQLVLGVVAPLWLLWIMARPVAKVDSWSGMLAVVLTGLGPGVAFTALLSYLLIDRFGFPQGLRKPGRRKVEAPAQQQLTQAEMDAAERERRRIERERRRPA